MLLELYKVATDLSAPFLTHHLKSRVRRGREDAVRLDERYGRATIERPDGPLLWMHAASVGESLAALPLLSALLNDDPWLHALITTGTVTSAKLMADRLPPRALHQFAPLDRASAWRTFFDHWRPDLGCLIESEIWPNLILEAERRQLPLALINGRLSARSAARWRYGGKAAARLLGTFALCLARSQEDAERLAALGAPDVRMLGDLKNATPPLPADADALARLEQAIDGRPVWLAASTHPGEETEILAVHRSLAEIHTGLLTVIAPRHPERGEELASALGSGGKTITRRSLGDDPSADDSLYLADTLGELGLFYRTAKVVFIGGSLVPHGGQNPLEAARLGCPPLFGPHTDNFQEMTTRLLEAGAARRVRDSDDLVHHVDALLTDPIAREQMVTRCLEVGTTETKVLTRVQQALAPLLRHSVIGDAPSHASA